MNQKKFFIGGVERSGTTILMRCMGMHKDISDLPRETQFFAYPKGLILVLKGYISISEFKENMLETFYQHVESFIGKDELSKLIDLCFEDESKDIYKRSNLFMNRLFDKYLEQTGKSYWIEKSPRNIVYADYLFDIFPNIRFIHIFREPLDVCSSHLNRGSRNIEKFIDYYNTTMKRSFEAYERLDKSKYLVIKFEDLVKDVKNKMNQIVDFLEIAKDKEFINDVCNRINTKRSNINRFEKSFSEKEILTINNGCEKVFNCWNDLKQ